MLKIIITESTKGCYNQEFDMMLLINDTYSAKDGKNCIGYFCEGDDGLTKIFR